MPAARQVSVQPRNVLPTGGVAVSITTVPEANVADRGARGARTDSARTDGHFYFALTRTDGRIDTQRYADSQSLTG